MNNLKVAILGAGNGAHAMAGHLGMKGIPVRLYNKFEEEIIAMRQRGGVTLEGAVEGFGPVELATTDPASVIGWADVIMVVVPAFVHRFMGEICAPHLHDGQTVILNPGRTGGALEFAKVLRERDVRAQVRVAEAQTLIYACRLSGPAQVRITGIKRQVSLAAFPATETAAVLDLVRPLYPQFVPAANVLETSLDNIGPVFHPGTVILNANRIEAGEDFDFYRGMTPAVTHFLEAIDRERRAVARAFGIELDSAKEWLRKTYKGVKGETLYERIQSNQAYAGIKAPKSLKVRYILEDIPAGLVPIASLGALAGVATPICRAVTDICCALLDRDFWAGGRTLENLGLAEMSVERIKEFVNTGNKGSIEIRD
ncbi:MAG TPA: NADP transhydrogenase subunit alpha [Anaerolineae bacterium]|nr:NADP transhydrogenase subunit alpha [Anaerolineae bacterium]HIQ04651.1 NADP transhydrogenase subunit alpha [Anaerolineae bacterium]